MSHVIQLAPVNGPVVPIGLGLVAKIDEIVNIVCFCVVSESAHVRDEAVEVEDEEEDEEQDDEADHSFQEEKVEVDVEENEHEEKDGEDEGEEKEEKEEQVGKVTVCV